MSPLIHMLDFYDSVGHESLEVVVLDCDVFIRGQICSATENDIVP